MRLMPIFAIVSLLLASCVSAPADGSAKGSAPVAGSKITVTAKGKSKLMPTNVASPGFSNLRVDVMLADALLALTTDVTPGGPASLGSMMMQSAAPACEVIGCPWTLPNVPILASSLGLMSVVSDARPIDPVWATTYAMVLNANQIQDNAKLGGAVTGSGPAYVLSQAGLQQLAVLVGHDSNTLLARGVGLGLVWSTRGEGTGIGTGMSQARIVVEDTGGTAPALYYLNDDMSNVSTTGTNQDGLFVLVGPDLTQPGAVAPPSYQVPITVTNATSAGVFANSFVIVRPGAITVIPVIPRR